MSAAIVATALASCTDDLGFNSNKQAKADLTATIEDAFPVTRMGMIEKGTAPYEATADNPSTWGLGWTTGDEIRVFTVKQLAYNYYELADGANTLEATFALKKANLNAAENVGENLYAVTDAQFVYGVSATADRDARLTYTIPYRWKATSTKSADGADVRKFPAPYWGIAIPDNFEAEGTDMTVSTKALTAFVRVDMSSLPAKTKYIVFTTHGNALNIKNENGDIVKDGFMLAAPKADGSDPQDFEDTHTWWEKKENGEYTNAQFITDGKSEPISGTFNAILDPTDFKNTWLKADPGLDLDDVQDEYSMYGGNALSRLVTRDEIIIELTPNTPAVFYVPIIVRGGGAKTADDGLRYENLHVIAATKLSQYAYHYVGTEIHNYNQERFYRGEYKFLSLNFENLGEVCPCELNKAIETANSRADRTSILNVDKLIKCDDGVAKHHTHHTSWDLTKYPMDRIQVSGTGKLVLNINAIEDAEGDQVGAATGAVIKKESTALKVKEPALYVTTTEAIPTGDIKDKVTINLPQYLGATAPAADANTKFALYSDLKAYNVVIGSVNGRDLMSWKAYVIGSKTKCVTGHNVLQQDGETLKDLKDAAINVVAGLSELNVLEETTGDVFVNQINEVEEPEILALNIQTPNQIDILITNGLVDSLNFVGRVPTNEAYVYTTGSSAIQKVRPITDVDDARVATVANDGMPANVSMYSYWTGAALSQKALKTAAAPIKAAAKKDYDVSTIYTVAQLASIGEGKGEYAEDGINYNIPHLIVKDMWLGAKTYPWIGAQAVVKGFTLDGENTPLRKMSFQDRQKIAGAGALYVDDPHMCCTTCGWIPAIYRGAGTDGQTEMTALGLIRSYVNTSDEDPVLIERVNLSDVWFETVNEFKNIGSIIGLVMKKGQFSMLDNTVTSPQFSVAGDNVGGMGGYIYAQGITVENNVVQDTDEEPGYIKSTKAQVGGLFGELHDKAGLNLNDNSVKIAGNIEGAARVGGIAGRFDLKEASNIIANEVEVEDILATQSYAGGIAGAIEAGKLVFGRVAEDERETESVKANNIKAGEDWAGGFAGEMVSSADVWVCEADVDVATELSAGGLYAGGLFGSARATTVNNRSAKINVGTLKAAEGFAGGEIGYVDAGDILVGGPSTGASANLVTDIAITKMSGAYAIGGVVGGNTNSSTLTLATAKKGTKTTPAYNTIDINVAAWENLKKDNPGFATFFSPDAADSKSHKAGTVSNVIGYLVGDLAITNAEGFNKEDLFVVTDNLDKTAKDNVGYKYHTDEQGNIPAGKWYWGDTNGYVGYGNAGYTINGKAQIAQGTNGFNLFKKEANYN